MNGEGQIVIDLLQSISIILQSITIIMLCKKLRLYSDLLNMLELRQSNYFKFYDKRLSKLEKKTMNELLYEEMIGGKDERI